MWFSLSCHRRCSFWLLVSALIVKSCLTIGLIYIGVDKIFRLKCIVIELKLHLLSKLELRNTSFRLLKSLTLISLGLWPLDLHFRFKHVPGLLQLGRILFYFLFGSNLWLLSLLGDLFSKNVLLLLCWLLDSCLSSSWNRNIDTVGDIYNFLNR